MKEHLKTEFQSVLFQTSKIHCSLHYFAREVIFPEWDNWRSLITVMLDRPVEFSDFVRPVKEANDRRIIFQNLKNLKNQTLEDIESSSLSFSELSSLAWLYFSNRGIFGKALALSCVEMSSLINRVQVDQMNSPAWIVEKLF